MIRNYDESAARASIEYLRRLAADNDSRVPVWAVKSVAKKIGVTERTIWIWLKDGIPEPSTLSLNRALENTVLLAVAAAHGKRKSAWNALKTQGSYSKSYAQFNRDLQKVSPIMLAGVTQGVKAALQKGLYLQGSTTGRLDRVLFDHTEADIRIQRNFRGNLEMFRPWVSFLLDSHTRVILSCIVTEGDGLGGDPGTESIVALLAAAIHGTTAVDGPFVGGVPSCIQYDNAKAHLAQAMVNGYLELGIATHAIRPGSPWEDGKVERLMNTFCAEFLSPLPGYTKALKDRYDRDPWKAEDCMSIDEFTTRLEQWVDHYNFERHHSAVEMTPFERWRDDPTPIRTVSDDLIRQGFLAETKGRKVSKNGVRFKNHDFTHELLGKLVGKRVTVRYLPNDRSFLEIYLNDQFVCSAVPHVRLSSDQRIDIVRARNQEIRRTDRIIKQSTARAREREREDDPLLAQERDPREPIRTLDSSNHEEYLTLLEEAAKIAKDHI